MTDTPPVPPPERWQEVLSRLASVILGGVYVYMGLSKAMHPVGFLKLVREYGLVDGPPVLNLIAATLPWFEAFCGLLLVAGVAVRGVALVSLGMLLPFTALVWQRASALQAGAGLPFCAIRFDCGCGAGEVLICYKLAENLGLMLLSTWLLIARRSTRCLWFTLLSPPSPSNAPTA